MVPAIDNQRNLLSYSWLRGKSDRAKANSGGTGFEESFEFGGGFAAEAGNFGELFDGCEAHALDGAEFFEEGGFASFADVGEFVQDAFGDFAEAKGGVVGVGEAMGFVADALEEF